MLQSLRDKNPESTRVGMFKAPLIPLPVAKMLVEAVVWRKLASEPEQLAQSSLASLELAVKSPGLVTQQFRFGPAGADAFTSIPEETAWVGAAGREGGRRD